MLTVSGISSGLRKINWGKVWLAYDYGSDFFDAVMLVYRFVTTGSVDAWDLGFLAASLLPFDDIFKAMRHLKWVDETVEVLANGGSIVKKTTGGAKDALQKVFKNATDVGMSVKKRSELVGEAGMEIAATAEKLKPTGFIKRYHGIDNIYKKADGTWVIAEAKGGLNVGASALGQTVSNGQQMSKEWIRKSLQKAAEKGDSVARDVLKELDKIPPKVEAMLVGTQIVDDVISEPTVIRKTWDAVGDITWDVP